MTTANVHTGRNVKEGGRCRAVAGRGSTCGREAVATGSTAFTTDCGGFVSQGFLYAPFGEIVSEYQGIAPSSALPKYAFNAKELDEETGMYYYEARYYNLPVFVSRDPMFEQKPWLSPYHYCSNNPTGRVDPTGMKIVIIGEDGVETTYEPGMTYDGNDKFTQKVITAQNEGYSKSATARRMIGELCESDFEYRIMCGEESNYTPSTDAVKSQYGSNETFYEKGGGVIKWNTSGMGTFEQNPKGGPSVLNKRPAIGLFHELGHAWDNMAGLLAANDMKFQDLEVSEWTATRTENMIRQDLGLPLRTWYYKSESGSPMFPRLLDRNGNHRYTQYQH